MVYLKGILVKATIAFVILTIFWTSAEAAATKIAYKKPINRQESSNAIKEQQSLIKQSSEATKTTSTKATTIATPSTAAAAAAAEETQAAVEPENATTTTTSTPLTVNAENTSAADIKTEQEKDEQKSDIQNIVTNKNLNSSSAVTANSSEAEINEDEDDEVIGFVNDSEAVAADVESATKEELSNEDILPVLDMPSAETMSIATNTTTSSTTTASTTTTTPTTVATTTTMKNTTTKKMRATQSNLPVPCTCGVFLTSQFRRGAKDMPLGKPVIMNELDRIFPCNAIGQKQCQTKCLETIVQHLPNSANILCATLDRDCHKERAYLFIKNCRNQWYNTNLAAGREYCCKNGQPYPCPMI